MRGWSLSYVLLLGAAGCQFTVGALAPGGGAPDLAMGGGELGPGMPMDLASPGDLGGVPPTPDLHLPGMLSGQLLAAPVADNLTLEGTIDWIEWGANGTFAIRKTGGTTLIDYTLVGGTVQQGSGYSTTFTWSDGAPTMAGTSSGAVYTTGGGSGFLFSANADPAATSTLRAYVGANNATGKMVAHLADGSAPDFVSTSVTSTGNTPNNVVFEFTYRPSSATKLTLTWTNNGPGGGNGIAALAAVTVQ